MHENQQPVFILINELVTGYYEHCHGLVCPTNTKICKKITTTSLDKNNIDIAIQCISKNGKSIYRLNFINFNTLTAGEILDQQNQREINPYPKETILKSVSVTSFLQIPVNYNTYNPQYKNN